MNFNDFGVKVHCQDELKSLNELGLVPYKHIDASTCSTFVLELFTRQHTSRKKILCFEFDKRFSATLCAVGFVLREMSSSENGKVFHNADFSWFAVEAEKPADLSQRVIFKAAKRKKDEQSKSDDGEKETKDEGKSSKSKKDKKVKSAKSSLLSFDDDEDEEGWILVE